MRTREIKSRLRRAGRECAPEELLVLCREEYAKRPHRRRMSRWGLVRSQLRFTALPVWLLQGAVLIFICVTLDGRRLYEYAGACASLAAELTALTLLPFCARARRYGMHEIEAAARINGARIALVRLAALGIGDAVCVSAIALLTGGAPYELLVLVVAPFLLTTVICLAVMEHAHEGAVLMALGLAAVFATAYWAFAFSYTKGLLSVSPAVAVIICLAALLALLCECRAMVSEKKLEKELGHEA